jgi:hypothetical protein
MLLKICLASESQYQVCLTGDSAELPELSMPLTKSAVKNVPIQVLSSWKKRYKAWHEN